MIPPSPAPTTRVEDGTSGTCDGEGTSMLRLRRPWAWFWVCGGGSPLLVPGNGSTGVGRRGGAGHGGGALGEEAGV